MLPYSVPAGQLLRCSVSVITSVALNDNYFGGHLAEFHMLRGTGFSSAADRACRPEGSFPVPGILLSSFQ